MSGTAGAATRGELRLTNQPGWVAPTSLLTATMANADNLAFRNMFFNRFVFLSPDNLTIMTPTINQNKLGKKHSKC